MKGDMKPCAAGAGAGGAASAGGERSAVGRGLVAP